MKITLVAAVAENGVIGRGAELPWRLPDDLRHFKATTLGGVLIMGRKTFESFGGHPLPQRRSIVVTRDPGYRAAGAEVVHSLEEALALAASEDEVFVIGGGEVFRQLLPRADRMVLTRVHAAPEGDTRFPPFDPDDWRLVAERHHPADERHRYAFTIGTYERQLPEEAP